jgi:hypothetical protein
VTLHQALLSPKHFVQLLSILFNLRILVLCKSFFFGLELLRLLAILSDLVFCHFTPFLEKFDVVVLGFLLDHFVVEVHLSHKLDVALMDDFHVFFYF